MKIINYKIDERKVLQSQLLKGNPNHTKESIGKILDKVFNNKDWG
jgi:hypothetical protein